MSADPFRGVVNDYPTEVVFSQLRPGGRYEASAKGQLVPAACNEFGVSVLFWVINHTPDDLLVTFHRAPWVSSLSRYPRLMVGLLHPAASYTLPAPTRLSGSWGQRVARLQPSRPIDLTETHGRISLYFERAK